MSDAFTPYETGLAHFLGRLGQDHPRYTEALTLEARTAGKRGPGPPRWG